MKLLSRLILLSLCLGLVPALGVADEFTPAEEEVCDFLLGPEFSPGLYGLCNAYCEAQDCDGDGLAIEDQPRNCQRLYHNFINKASGPDDPVEMPCLEASPEPLVPPCLCWPEDEDGSLIPDALEPGLLPGGGAGGVSCVFDEATDFYGAGFADDSGFVLFLLDDFSGKCSLETQGGSLVLPVDEDPDEPTRLSDTEFNDCKLGMAFIRDVYFPVDNDGMTEEGECEVIPEPEPEPEPE